MKRFYLSAMLGTALMLGGAAEAKNTVIRQVPVTDKFNENEMRFSGQPKGYTFRWGLVAPEGVIELCGVGVTENISLSSVNRQALRKVKLTMNGKTILRDITFFSKAKSVKALDRAKANCVSTGVRVPKAGKVDIRLESDAGRYKG